MSRIAITLEDVEGSVQANVVWEDGFNTESNAHQVAQLILKHLDTVMEKYSETTVGQDTVVLS